MTEAEANDLREKAERALHREGDPGLNTILLNIATSMGTIAGACAAIEKRLAVIEPVLWELESERLRRQGLRQGLARYFRWAHALWLGLGAAAAWAAQHLPGWPWIKP